jgi:type IV pilus assembly protein PilV
MRFGKLEKRTLKKQTGFTLIEVMVSVVLLTIGLLAIGAGELTVLQSSRGTTNRIKAIAAGEYMLELIRRNNDNILGYNNANTKNDAFATTTNIMTQLDFNDWQTKVSEIPGAVGSIAFQAGALGAGGPMTLVSVGVFWLNGPPVAQNLQDLFGSVGKVTAQNGIILQTNIPHNQGRGL